jgi:predicted DNA-binding protein (MmcQ/YjbR family)
MALLDRIRRDMKYKPQKDLVTLRNQEKIFFAVKEYDNAQFMRMKANEQEMYEMS